MLKFMDLKGKKGITIMTLTVMIIILLILAGISISMLTGENGLIKNAGNAKEQAEIDGEKELIETAIVQAMGNNKYGNITVDELQKILEDDATVGKIRKKIVITINDSQRMYYVDDDGNVFEYEYFDLAIMENGTIFYNRMADYRTSILSVTVIDNMNIPENAYQVFDVSKEQNETVKAWLVENVENTDMYDLYIGSNDGVEIENCKNMFSDLTNCISIDIENLYTSKVKDFGYMFTCCNSLISINMNNIDTSNATNMNSMFASCKNLIHINLNILNTDNVSDMSAMFYGCEKLEELDFINFNTKNVRTMNGMFRQCYSLKSLDLSNFDMTNVIRTDYMFYYCPKLEKVYVGQNWDEYTNITTSTNMFGICPKLIGAISYDSSKVDITYANYNTGYFTYKSNE